MQNLNIERKELLRILFITIISLFIFLTVLTGVEIVNKIKEGKYIGQEIEAKETITVTATGEVFAKPDLAIVSISVKEEAKTVTEATEKNTEKMNAAISFLKESGVEEKDLKTTGFNIYPRYEYVKDWEAYPFNPTGKRTLVGYEVVQSLQIKIRDMSEIGTLLKGVTDQGINEISNLQFTIDKEEEFKVLARNEAIEKAKDKAEELASQLGINLMKIVNFQESNTYPRFYNMEKTMMEMGGGDAVVPEIEIGESTIEVSVTITYAIN